MPKALAVVGLDRTKGNPSVEVIFGHAALGTYRVFLWDAAGKNPSLLAHGNNIDEVVDMFEIAKSPEELDGSILSYELIVQAPEPKDGQMYSVTISVRQEGNVCDGGLIQETGTFNDVKSIIGFRRFQS
jgi:hypothetical protein